MTTNNQDNLRCGVVGVGRMGRHHARIYGELPDTEFIGVLDPDDSRAQDAVERNGGRAFSSIDSSDSDVVIFGVG